MKHRLLDYMDKVVGDHDKEQKLRKLVDCFFETVKTENPELYYGTMLKIHSLAYGRHFDLDTAKMAVARMKNADGTAGGHWTPEETDVFAEQSNIKQKADFYYAMNMMWSDYSKILGKDASNYAAMAEAYMCDTDAPEGRPFCEWAHRMSMEVAGD